MNAGGHTGFEFIPKSVSSHPLFKIFNTVTHHDSHHTNLTKNFGSFFNIWDRWMGTFLDAKTPSEDKIAGRTVTMDEPHLEAGPKFAKRNADVDVDVEKMKV
jgi:sterol desaturase/sphingolipid hydroxylase (fatty acid hydroxylase superfamily)